MGYFEFKVLDVAKREVGRSLRRTRSHLSISILKQVNQPNYDLISTFTSDEYELCYCYYDKIQKRYKRDENYRPERRSVYGSVMKHIGYECADPASTCVHSNTENVKIPNEFQSYDIDDVVGCGYNANRKEVLFTKNGHCFTKFPVSSDIDRSFLEEYFYCEHFYGGNLGFLPDQRYHQPNVSNLANFFDRSGSTTWMLEQYLKDWKISLIGNKSFSFLTTIIDSVAKEYGIGRECFLSPQIIDSDDDK